jgi:gamma-glutamyltranspeptidase
MYRPLSDTWPDYMEVDGRENSVGLRAVGVPGTLTAWCEMLRRFGTLDLPTVMAPAIRHADAGFRVTGYLSECIVESAIPDTVRAGLAARGHHVVPVAHVAGGMGAIAFAEDGTLTGASCWRADGTPIGIGGGYARTGIRFWPEARRGSGTPTTT